ncbi:MAG TPA: glycosyltransferase family 39 protein, partial [Pyrinomonadaceae bacterium]|nr:glycosyltransferase family 39 protein [Pyrinomonadaceae bacterium]
LRGDWVTPTLGGHTWFEKPALLYWMMMASYHFFGVSEWAARLGPALSGLITTFLLYWMGRRLDRAYRAENETGDNGGFGLWSGVAAASSGGLIVFSRAASFDIVVTMTLTAALCCFFVAEVETSEKRRRLCLAGFYAAIGASLLAKGLVGVVIPAGILGLYYLMRREWPRRNLLLSALWGIPLACAVAAAWYAPVIYRHGWTFVDEFFIQHHFARFISDKYHHPQRVYFYIPIILMLTLPWTVLFIKGLLRGGLRDWRERTIESKTHVFALAWVIAPVVFFSFSGSKLPGYILPALPGAMLLVGERLVRFVRGEEGCVALRITGAIIFAVAIAGVVYTAMTGELTILCSIALVAPLAVAGVFNLLVIGGRAFRVELIASAMFISVALVLNCGVARISERESVRGLLRLADARGYTETPVFYMLTDDRTGEFYAGGRLGYKADGEPFRFDGANEAADAARERGGTALVFVPTKWENQLTDYHPVETEVIGSNGVLTLAAIRVR